MLFRSDASDAVRFMQLNAVTARLIALLQEGERLVEEVLVQLVAELGYADRAAFMGFGMQVLQELHVNLMRKGGLDPAASWRRVSDYLAWKVIDNDRLLLAAAFDVQTRWKLSYWDSLIVAAAQRSGAPLLWSEDLAEGQRYDDVRAINPLRA